MVLMVIITIHYQCSSHSNDYCDIHQVNLNWIVSSDALEPTYLLRCFGPAFPRGLVFAINPFVIVWLTPILAGVS